MRNDAAGSEPLVYRELYRTGALEEYLDLSSRSNRDLYLTLTAQGKAGPQQQATARGSGAGADA